VRIALVQLDVEVDTWSEKELPNLLRQAAGTDLVVFPECMPFENDKEPVTHVKAVKVLEKAGQEVSDCTFIAGGYVTDGRHTYNRVYLVNRGVVEKYYDKQIRWTGEIFTPGTKAERFEWAGSKCIPLICADAGDDLTPQKVRMMAAAIEAGAGKDVPIVICSYGGGLMTDYWQPALQQWSQGCEAPVVICGIAGTHPTLKYPYKGENLPFGGGGSGVFWSDGLIEQCKEGGIVVVDLKERRLERKDIHKPSRSRSKK
jgi:predicted amidohydrolase